MEESIYSKLPKLKIELNLVSLVGGVLVIIFAFIIPISIIQNITTINSNTIVSGPQVAGLSTERTNESINLPLINKEVSLEGQSGQLIALGLLILGISTIIILFLFFDSFRKRKF